MPPRRDRGDGDQPGLGARPRANLKVLARHLGLSVTTVSRALKNAPEVSRATIERVKRAASAFDYAPDRGGLALRTGRSLRLAVLQALPPEGEISNIGFLSLLEGISEVLAGTPYRLSVLPQRPGEDPIPLLRTLIAQREADGVIISMTQPQDSRIRFLLERRFPFVAFGRAEMFSPFPFVDIDHVDIAMRAVARFVREGRRRIALVAPPAAATYSLHLAAGYRHGLERAGLAYDPAFVTFVENGAMSGRRAIAALLAGPGCPDAVLCCNDMTTLGVIDGLLHAGIVPARDVALIANGGTLLPTLFNPPVPCFMVSHTEIGRQLAALLVRAVEGEDPANLQAVLKAALATPERRFDPAHAASRPMPAATGRMGE
jgi:LacI family transcriptional regulator